VGSRRNELGRLPDLRLAHDARTKWVVRHHGKELHRPPVASDDDGQHLPDSRIIVSSSLTAFDSLERPAGNQADTETQSPGPNRRRTRDVPRQCARQRARPGLSRRSRTRPGRRCPDSSRPTIPRLPLVAPAIARIGPTRSKSRAGDSTQRRTRRAHTDRSSFPQFARFDELGAVGCRLPGKGKQLRSPGRVTPCGTREHVRRWAPHLPSIAVFARINATIGVWHG
jgi:hypothetical protein